MANGAAGLLEICVSAIAVVAETVVPEGPPDKCASPRTISLPSDRPARSWNAIVLVPAGRPVNAHVRTGPFAVSVMTGSGIGAALPGTYSKSGGMVTVVTTFCRLPAPSSVTASGAG